MTRAEFVKQIGSSAKAVCSGTPFFASTMIAQAALESGNGDSQLAIKGKNFFGIKAAAGQWSGKTIVLPTREFIRNEYVTVKAYFRAYDTLEDSFRDRNSFLIKNPRYAKAGVLSAITPEAQAFAFEVAGYATDPMYSELISTIINGSSRLKQYDQYIRQDFTAIANLNLRTSPNTGDNILLTMVKGDKLAAVSITGDWFLVYHYKSFKYGYVSKKYVK